MPPFAATVRYRYGERGEGRDASFYGLFFDRSERAVLGRLREAHRFADWVEVVEVRWREGARAREGGRGGRQYFAPPPGGRGSALLPARRGDAWGGGAGEARAGGPWVPRRHARCRMFKAAYVVTDGAALGCVLLDLSPGGARICLLARAELPDLVTLWLPGGGSRPVRRRWQRGLQIGFEAVGDAVPPS
jgi:hypothetical protein